MKSNFNPLTWLFIFFLFPLACLNAASNVTITHLRCDYLRNPLGIDDPRPVFSWQLESDQRGQRQTAYQILVASSPELLAKDEGDQWDSGKVISHETLGIAYAGASLRSSKRYYWKVKIWDKDQDASAWTGDAWFETGLFQPTDWLGKWIGCDATAVPALSLKGGIWIWYPGENAFHSAPPGTRYFRKILTISPDAKVHGAWFAGTADNQFTLFVNGHMAGSGDEWRKPGYVELTPWLHGGLNCIAIEAKNTDQSPAGLLGKIKVELDDNEVLTEQTDRSWKASRQEAAGWRMPEFDDSSWMNAEAVTAFGNGPWEAPELVPMKDQSPLPAPMLRKEFDVSQPVSSARLYICGLGLYDVRLNGMRVGDSVLNPAQTRYDKRLLYATYDITSLLKTGTNCIAVELGRGFYDVREQTPWDWNNAPWRSAPKLICQINLTFADGTTTAVPSDSSWMLCVDGPERADSIYWGEIYDARLEKPGWMKPGFDGNGFTHAGLVSAPIGQLRAQELPAIKIVQTIHPVSVSEPKPGDYVFDVGFVTAGWARFSASCPRGTSWTIRYAEKLKKNGTVDQYRINDINGLLMADTYVFKGEGRETWEPRFSYKGFKYVEIMGSPVPLTTNNLEIRIVHSDVEPIGGFECSNPLFNTLHENATRTILNNLHGIPTDTPVFEKNGWMGDANVIAETTLFNFDMTSFFEKWTKDMRDCMGNDGLMPQIVPTGGWGMCHSPEWNSAFVFITWDLYEYNGDKRILEENYADLKKYASYEIGQLKGNISNSCLNDWGSPETHGRGMGAPEGGELTSTAYTYRGIEIMSEVAKVLGKTEKAKYYAGVCAQMRAAFNQHFFNPGSESYHTDIPAGYRQTSNILPLAFGLTAEDQRGNVLTNLVTDIQMRNDHLNTGILGTKYLLPLLTANGQAEVAYSVANQETYPSWGWWVKHGATTMWEAWELNGRSRDHYMFGTVDEWFFKYLAGIRPDPANAGFQHFFIHPIPMGDLTWVKAHFDSVRGRIVSEWKKGDGKFTLHIVVPPNTRATIYLPANNPESVFEGGQPVAKSVGVTFQGKENDISVFEVGSGSYSFEIH